MAPTTLAEMALSHVEVKFLPKNTTSIMQPMDQERVQPSHLPICKLDWNGKDLSNLLSQMGLIWCRVTTNSQMVPSRKWKTFSDNKSLENIEFEFEEDNIHYHMQSEHGRSR